MPNTVYNLLLVFCLLSKVLAVFISVFYLLTLVLKTRKQTKHNNVGNDLNLIELNSIPPEKMPTDMREKITQAYELTKNITFGDLRS